MGRTAEDSGKEQTWHHSRRGWTSAKISGEVETRYRCHYTRSFLQRSVVFGEQSCYVFVVPHNHGTKIDQKSMFIQTRMMMVSSITLREKLRAKQQMNKTLQIGLILFEKLILWWPVMMPIFLNLSDIAKHWSIFRTHWCWYQRATSLGSRLFW